MRFKVFLHIFLIFSLCLIANGQSNCSENNKCGRYGYCYTVEEEAFCECKFWWEGESCNIQSDNGKQVIALGILCGITIFTFYGLKIGRTIYKKFIQKSGDSTKDQSRNVKQKLLFQERIKKISMSSYIVLILTIVLTTITLLGRWSLIKDIHNEIVYKFTNNVPVYYTKKSVCRILDIGGFNAPTFALACVVLIICIIQTKRISFMKNRCHGYGGTPVPLDFFSHLDRTFAVVVFAIISDELIFIVQQILESSGSGQGILVRFLIRIFQVLIMGFRFYPILAAVYIDSILTLTFATIYAWFDYAITSATQNTCDSEIYPTYIDYIDNSSSIAESFKYYGTGSSLIAIQICSDIPRYLCLSYISVKLPVLLVQKIYKQRKTVSSDEEKTLLKLSREEIYLLNISKEESVEMLYVKNLFRSPDQRPPTRAILGRLIPKFIYEWRDDFLFSSRVLCIYSSIFLLLFSTTYYSSLGIIPILNDLQSSLQDLVNSLVDVVDQMTQISADENDNVENTKPPLNFPLPNLVAAYLCALALTVTIIVVQLVVLLVNIRRNLLQAYRGDDSEIPRRQRSKYISYATGNFHFAGYFIGYLIWGFIIIATLSTILCVCIGSLILYLNVRALEKFLKFIIPSILLVIFKLFLNKLLAQYVFLQHYGDVLALKNRRGLMIFIYFNFFLDAFLGFISSILRFIKSGIGTIIYMCRLDYSSLGRKLEEFDSGFNAYCGFIHTECTHRHPIMLVFVSSLFAQVKHHQYQGDHMQLYDLPTKEKDIIQRQKSLRYIRKWRLAAFLVRNPAILFFRKTFLKRLTPNDLHLLNDIDNDQSYNTKREVSFYTRQMAAQRFEFLKDTNLETIVTCRF